MSGGSYNYLFNADADDIVNRIGDIQAMRDRLAGLGYAEDAASETERLLQLVLQYRVRINVALQRLSPVWHGMEWWDSADQGEADFKEDLARYRGEEVKK